MRKPLNSSSTEGAPSPLPLHFRTGLCFGGKEGDEGLPDIDDLVSRLRFIPKEGRIWLDTQRVMLVNLSTFGSLRGELIDTVGMSKARGVLTRMGYSAGCRDAELARKLRPQSSLTDSFLVGPQLRALKGGGHMEAVTIDVDAANGKFFAEFITKESFEVDSYVSSYGIAGDPVCWMQTGYASGFTSTFLGRSILFREVECRAMGGACCRLIGKAHEEWDETEDDLRAVRADEFASRFPGVSQNARLMADLNPDGEPPPDRYHDMLVGASSEFMAVCRMLQKAARTPATVLFRGETGVGKEILAKTLHRISRRASSPFVAINCAAIPENLIESELFGVEKGAYTGATQSRPGRFERANGGTLFLDEVGTLTPTAQIKLLRAIQEGEIERIGDTCTRKVDVRLVAATNINLDEAVEAGAFREDLFFRLNVFPIHIPPLRSRRDDIPLLMDYFLRKLARLYEKRVAGFTARAVDALYEYDYPGNIRELENLIERAVIMVEDGEPIDLKDLFASQKLAASTLMRLDRSGTLHNTAVPPRGEGRGGDSIARVLDEIAEGSLSLKGFEERVIQAAVERAGGNVAAAARLLHVTRSQIDYRLRRDR